MSDKRILLIGRTVRSFKLEFKLRKGGEKKEDEGEFPSVQYRKCTTIPPTLERTTYVLGSLVLFLKAV